MPHVEEASQVIKRLLRRSLLLPCLLAIDLLTGCGAGSANTDCGPDGVSYSNSYGTISVQQRSAGAPLQWGAYPSVSVAGIYAATVKVNGKMYDFKSQSYPPHGSISAKYLPTGALVRIDGSYRGPAGDQSFWIECRSL